MPHLKLVLMSATFAAETFVPFFRPLRGSFNDPDPSSMLSFEGRTFPIKEYFLEDALEWTGISLKDDARLSAITEDQLHEIDEALFEFDDEKEYKEDTLRSLATADEKWITPEKKKLIVAMIERIDRDSRKNIENENGKGSILVFLPGWGDIQQLGEELQRKEAELGHVGEMERIWHILPLHSQLMPEEQQSVFDPAPPGRRKIILSTNIAETSVTISDVVYVINSGIAKEMTFDHSRMTGTLENTMVSWANNTQRKGRAGRCQEGICIHLFPRFQQNGIKQYQSPEILSNALEEHILQVGRGMNS